MGSLNDPPFPSRSATVRRKGAHVVRLALALTLSACGGPDRVESETPAVGGLPSDPPARSAEPAQPFETIELTDRQIRQAQARLGGFETRTFHTPLVVNGVLDVPPMRLVELGAVFPGYVHELHILEGQVVRRGELLYTLQDPEYLRRQRDYLESTAELEYLNVEYDRVSKLHEEQAVSAKEFARIGADRSTALARAGALRLELDLMGVDPEALTPESMTSRIEIRAPIDGIVTDVRAHVGEYVSASGSVAALADLDHPHLELKVFEQDAPLLEAGQRIQFSGLGSGSRPHEAEVFLIGRDVDEEERSVSVHAHLVEDGMPDGLALGSYVTARILTRPESGLALPLQAVLVTEEGAYVFLQVPGEGDVLKFERHPVRTGRSDSSHVQILDPQQFPDDAVFLLDGVFQLASE